VLNTVHRKKIPLFEKKEKKRRGNGRTNTLRDKTAELSIFIFSISFSESTHKNAGGHKFKIQVEK
jgi:hypothetical protein